MQVKRNIYALEALKYTPQLFTLLDRNKFSATYGCLDREFWHYKTADFPCGMSQEAVLALSLLYKHEFPNNIFYNNERVKELALAAIGYAMRASHPDGSCDEYYPFEKALGATAFSLQACAESYLILETKNPDFEIFFKTRANWLLKNPEVGVLANHEALSALALLNVYLITGEKKYQLGAEQRIGKTLACQSSEGWFQEYDGCDPGYLTWTIDSLAKYFKKTNDKNLLPPLKKAIKFASYFIHPDGSFGGEYGSRNSHNFFPHGFEILGKYFPLATQICDQYIEGMKRAKRAYLDENRIFSHHMTNYLQAYLDFNEKRANNWDRNDFEKYFKKAGIYVGQKKPYYTVISLKKGGVVKLFKNNLNIYNDNGFIGQLNDNQIAVSHLLSPKTISITPHLSVTGKFQKVKSLQPTLVKFLIFRLGLLCLGKISYSSKFIRKILQKILITAKKTLPLTFQREFIFNKGLTILDTLKLTGNKYFKRLAIGTDHTSIYTAVSNCYQESALHKWIDLDTYLDRLKNQKEIKIKREIC